MGYGTVYDFSYRGGRNPQPYEAKDTVRDLRDDARDLRDLLDQIAIDRPGVPVDVIAHSQGGLIAREALAHDYDGPGHVMPNVEHFVTLGTPHHGADAATANAWLRWTPMGQAIRAWADDVGAPFDLNGPGMAQLAETSDFIRDINDRPLREGVAYTSVAGANDLIVPAVRARLQGAANTVIDVAGPLKTHTLLPDSAAGQREVALAIADMPPTCVAIATLAFRAFSGLAISQFEDAAGAAAVTAASRT
jgi:pimeloyl-ACP methyl ester carboxylesterase